LSSVNSEDKFKVAILSFSIEIKAPS
jgi:hypothetical protein